MKIREIRKIVSTLLAVAMVLIFALALNGCAAPVPPVDRSPNLPPIQPPAVSTSVGSESLPADPAPVVPPVEKPAEPPAAQPSSSGEVLLTRAQVEAIALSHAGLTAGQVWGLRSEFDIDDGVKAWDVEFRCDGWEYDYEIHAVSGTIRSFDKERD